MALVDQDRRALADIARQLRAEDPELAAALTDRPSRPPAVWAPVGLRALAFVLVALGTLAAVPQLIPVAFAVLGIAHLFRVPGPGPTNAD
jgi:hypothetical protein